MHRVRVRIVEDALDANNTIARANRDDFDRAGVTRRESDGRAGGRQDGAARTRAARPRRRAAGRARGRRPGHARCRPARLPARARDADADRGGGSAASAISTQTWSAPRSPSIPLGRDRPAGDRERRQPRLPGRVPGRRGRAGDGRLGHRGRGQAAQVPADVPRLRARRAEQDRPAAASSTSTSRSGATHVETVHPGVPCMLVSARTGEGVEAFREWLAGDAGAPLVEA